jgi:hypothetical protein
MSQEITVSASLSLQNSVITSAVARATTSAKVDQSGQRYLQGVMHVPITAGGTAIPVSGLVAPGWLYLKNLDATNFITILNAASGNALVKLKPGEVAMFRLAAAAPAALADTAICDLEYLILDN